MSLFDQQYGGVITINDFYCMSVCRGDGRCNVSAVHLGAHWSVGVSSNTKNHHKTIRDRRTGHVINCISWTHYQHHVSQNGKFVKCCICIYRSYL